MKIYNTLTKQKEEFVPRKEGHVNMFVCGPTVYDYIHIGNARTFVFFDVVAKYLKSQHYKVEYIQNITDIDDKIINRALEADKNPLNWASDYQEKFEEDMKKLSINSPKYAPATKHIKEVVKQIKTLIDKDFAYEIPGDGWYFDLSKFPEYGKLSGRTTLSDDDAVSRIDENDKKRNPGDFALWKISKEGEPSWDTELGKGRPGWHIEDTAITEHYFGPQYDLHGGGQDLIFPHHEAEITQQESASGQKPFVKYWMHVAFLINKDKKMSKSLGNFSTAHDLLEKYSKEVLRFYLLSGHYRQPLEFSDKNLNQSAAGVNRTYEFMQKLSMAQGEGDQNLENSVNQAKEKFDSAMNDDFNTPEALAAIFELIREVNPALSDNSVDKKSLEEIKEFIGYADSILGIAPTEQKEIPQEIVKLIEQREQLRKDKKYDEADKIRAQIKDLGYEVDDTIYGPLANKI